MSKSLGNGIEPQEILQQSGADILRLWVIGSDYSEDVRIGPEILDQPPLTLFLERDQNRLAAVGSLHFLNHLADVIPLGVENRLANFKALQRTVQGRRGCVEFCFNPAISPDFQVDESCVVTASATKPRPIQLTFHFPAQLHPHGLVAIAAELFRVFGPSHASIQKW